MAHPDHDQVIGRLVGARLRGPADRRPGGATAAEAHPDAETWAAYVDGGLLPDEVNRLEDHLGGCGVCRQLVAALAPDVSATAPAVRDAEPAPARRAAVIPFPRRQVFVWMGVAASLFAAVTLWSVSRLGSNARMTEMSVSVAPPESAVAPPASPRAPSAAGAGSATAPATRADAAAPVDQVAARPPDSPARRLAQAEQDKTAARAADSDTLARQRGAAVPALGRTEPTAAAGAIAGAAAGGATREMAKATDGAKPAEEKRLADAAPAVAANARPIQLQTNTVAAGAARAHGPLATQTTNTQQNAPVAQAPPPPPAAPLAAASPTPPPAAAPAAAKPDAAQAPARADAREQRENEQQAGLAETVTTTGAAPGARTTRGQRAAARAAGARSVSAPSKDEAGTAALFRFSAAPPVFAEPGGRLQWRIVEGRRLQSSSDGGTTWSSPRYTARRRLRAGTAPAIDSAWAVGEDGLVLRFSVPGDWTEVPPPAPVTLTGVSATGPQSARVTAADGRVFETADGGATWTPATAGAGPQ